MVPLRAVAADPLNGMTLGVRLDHSFNLFFVSTFMVDPSAVGAFFKVVVLTRFVRAIM